MEYIDTRRWAIGSYFSHIVEGLVQEGYQRGVNVHGAPYDFRKAANEHGGLSISSSRASCSSDEYFGKLKTLVEDTFAVNGNTSVVLASHR